MCDVLLHGIDEYCARTGTPPTRFGAALMGDSAFVGTLRGGLDLRLSTFAKLMSWLDLHRSDQEPLPAPLRGRAKEQAQLAALAMLRADRRRSQSAAASKQSKKRGK